MQAKLLDRMEEGTIVEWKKRAYTGPSETVHDRPRRSHRLLTEAW
jgi:hypothetical protein